MPWHVSHYPVLGSPKESFRGEAHLLIYHREWELERTRKECKINYNTTHIPLFIQQSALRTFNL